LTGKAPIGFGTIEQGCQHIALQTIERDEVTQATGAVLL
jgi:hypothetical protein